MMLVQTGCVDRTPLESGRGSRYQINPLGIQILGDYAVLEYQNSEGNWLLDVGGSEGVGHGQYSALKPDYGRLDVCFCDL